MVKVTASAATTTKASSDHTRIFPSFFIAFLF
jgi:hypothetical protein